MTLFNNDATFQNNNFFFYSRCSCKLRSIQSAQSIRPDFSRPVTEGHGNCENLTNLSIRASSHSCRGESRFVVWTCYAMSVLFLGGPWGSRCLRDSVIRKSSIWKWVSWKNPGEDERRSTERFDKNSPFTYLGWINIVIILDEQGFGNTIRSGIKDGHVQTPTVLFALTLPQWPIVVTCDEKWILYDN